MTGEIGAEFRYICETCLEVLGPRDLRQHATDGCAACMSIIRVDLWLVESVTECPKCGESVGKLRPVRGVTTVEWHESGAGKVQLFPCTHTVDTEAILHEHRAE